MSDLAEMEELQTPIIEKKTNNKDNDKLKKEQSSIVQKESIIKKTTEDVQRAIEGLKEIPDKELQEFLDDDFMEGLNVVDAWEGEEDKNREEKKSQAKENEQVTREHNRKEHKVVVRNSREKSKREEKKREEKKREEIRRDPSKSTKDIERDKMRTKRDNESKLLAEKEKAIKNLLDSDNVVPPGTESEAIQSITDKQNEERVQMRNRKSRERRRSQERIKLSPVRRKSYDRCRASPHRRILSPIRRRSPFRLSSERVNCDRRSPLILSPERRRSPYHRRLSWERRLSADRRWSAERHKRRMELQERRRSRSRDRQRSRSMERFRRRSRSPINRRYSPRRRSRTRSRSLERRTRKRSPFINELARQLRNEAIKSNSTYIPASSMEGISPIMNTSIYSQETEVRGALSQSYMHQGGPLTPAQQPQPPPSSSVLPMSSGMQPFMNFDIPSSQTAIGFDGAPLHSIPPAHYSSGPVMYNHNTVQTNTIPTQSGTRAVLHPAPHQTTPQPVPAPVSMDQSVMGGYVPQHGVVSHLESSNHKPVNAVLSPSSNYKDHRSSLSSNNGYQLREERLKTPEPPVISDTKQFEKTSLSSLLEASVSAKDSTSPPVLYPGFKPEILRHCEHALRGLPIEDPRLKRKGRFFFDPKKADSKSKYEEYPSNSILLLNGKKIYWEEEEVQQYDTSLTTQTMQMHQKICQTEEIEMDSKSVEAHVDMVDFEMQVYPHDIEHEIKEERKSIMDRLDWNTREKHRDADDLRWNLSNLSHKRPWKRTLSPPNRRSHDRDHFQSVPSPEHPSRNLETNSSKRSRDSYSRGSIREQYDRYSPNYNRSMNIDDFRENRSDRSRGESPIMNLGDSEEDSDETFTFQRENDWCGRGRRPFRGKSTRGKYSRGRQYRARCSFNKF
ncbi:PREDICTED: serine/arginine repetitive matrix protein 2-like [Polistes dominula]|uniref:Serine/arginine repetitive matrix protein 2-like n=1 Tax=Polistes dominula TaxID=743375 RepID=A0ABM1IPP4_POLDO|nr:PREDICTED: serine/arginine repetitive matrix protein 2-like [Polistes dominula]XP_015182181.1 PREDICTED: serine/arginine repetitive matrix protein 2-like [Polistes dominula]XP_015182190.1 PREDICTED: serine/arginine repetitive matrix protein 2-like [Polistes dominula]